MNKLVMAAVAAVTIGAAMNGYAQWFGDSQATKGFAKGKGESNGAQYGGAPAPAVGPFSGMSGVQGWPRGPWAGNPYTPPGGVARGPWGPGPYGYPPTQAPAPGPVPAPAM